MWEQRQLNVEPEVCGNTIPVHLRERLIRGDRRLHAPHKRLRVYPGLDAVDCWPEENSLANVTTP